MGESGRASHDNPPFSIKPKRMGHPVLTVYFGKLKRRAVRSGETEAAFVSMRPLARRVVRMADSLSGCPGPLRYTSQMGTDRASCAFASCSVAARDSGVSTQERMRSGLRAEIRAAELS